MNYGYIRVSSDKQTVENQRFKIENFEVQNNLHIDGWIEETISGTKNNERAVSNCPAKIFQLEHSYRGCAQGINETIIAMAVSASGIRDTSRVLNISTGKVMSTFKKLKYYIRSISNA